MLVCMSIRPQNPSSLDHLGLIHPPFFRPIGGLFWSIPYFLRPIWGPLDHLETSLGRIRLSVVYFMTFWWGCLSHSRCLRLCLRFSISLCQLILGCWGLVGVSLCLGDPPCLSLASDGQLTLWEGKFQIWSLFSVHSYCQVACNLCWSTFTSKLWIKSSSNSI